jgi:peroxiredoxin
MCLISHSQVESSRRIALASPPTPARERLAFLVTAGAVAVLMLTNVHHVYGAYVYATPWRAHVLLLTVPTMMIILASRRWLLRSPTNRGARWVFMLATLAVPVLGIGAFEGLYNHVLKDVLFLHGASAELMTRLFPPPRYEMPNDAFFEITGVAQVIPAAATAWWLHRFAARGSQGMSDTVRVAPTVVSPRVVTTISDRQVPLPDPASAVHLQFRRFAGCPVCSLHLRTFVRRQAEIQRADVREVVVFHASPDELRAHASDLPFDVVADPDKVLYREFGVESSARAVLDPRAWGAILRGTSRSLVAILRGVERSPALRPQGGGLGLPADFLIARDGRVVASKYGEHADDQWSVDELLALARAGSHDRGRAS